MMQDNKQIPLKEKFKWRKPFLAGKIMISLIVFYYIYRIVTDDQKNLSDIIGVITALFTLNNLVPILFLFILVPINWTLESLKWQILVERVMPISLKDSFIGVLSGLALGVVVPAQVGDTFGRVGALKTNLRFQAIGAALISNGIQFYISIIAGIAGWIYWNDQLAISAKSKFWLAITLLILIALGLILFFSRKKLLSWKPKHALMLKIKSYLAVIAYYSSNELLLASAYGMLRYAVFIIQYIILFSLFSVELNMITISACVSLVLLAKTIIPALNAIGDLGLREFTALLVFRPFHLTTEVIVAATFIIWIINIMCPILVGLFIIWKNKWKLKI